AASVADELRSLGFVVPPDGARDAAATDVAATSLRFGPGAEARADLVRRALRADVAVDASGAEPGAHVVLTLRADWPGAGAAPPPTGGGTSVPPARATTSSLPTGVVPGDRPDGGSC